MKTREGRVMRGRSLRVAVMVVLGGFALTRCYIFSPSQAQVDKAQTQLHFNLAECQQTAPNLYKCPAVDQPLCTPEFTRTDINCVHIGPKGSVFIQRQGANP